MRTLTETMAALPSERRAKVEARAANLIAEDNLTNAEGLADIEPMPLEQYLRTHFRPDRDYINGAARERNVGYRSHSETMAIVGAMLSTITRATDMATLMSVRMWIDDHTIMLPDLAVISRSQRNENIIVTPPILCVEIKDFRDTLPELEQRADKYLAMGVKNIWVIDPDKRVGYYATSKGLDQSVDAVMKVAGSGIAIELASVFAGLDGG